MTLTAKEFHRLTVDLNMSGKACDRIAEKIGGHKIIRPREYFTGSTPEHFTAFLNCTACGREFPIHAHPTPGELNDLMRPCAAREGVK